MKKTVVSQPVSQTPALKAKAHKVVAPAKPAVPAKPASGAAPEAAKAEAEPKAKTPKAPKAVKFVSKDEFLGRHMRVAEYQDYTFSVNDRPDRQLTDEELCADWQRQFPNAVKFETFHVRGARRDFNAGLHSKQFPGKHESVPFAKGADGKRAKAPYVRAVKPAAPKTGAPAQPVASDAAKTSAAKVAAKVAVKKTTKAA